MYIYICINIYIYIYYLIDCTYTIQPTVDLGDLNSSLSNNKHLRGHLFALSTCSPILFAAAKYVTTETREKEMMVGFNFDGYPYYSIYGRIIEICFACATEHQRGGQFPGLTMLMA